MRLTLRQTLGVAGLLLLVGPFATIALVTGRKMSSSLGDLTDRLAGELSLRCEQRVRAQLAPADRVMRELRMLARRGDLNPSDRAALGLRLADRLRYESALSEVSFGDADGNFTAASRGDTGLEIRTKVGPEGPLVFESVDPAGVRRRLSEITLDYDPRERPWYKAGAAARGQVWVGPYEWKDGTRGLTCAAAVRDGDALLGVLTTDIRLRALARFLRDELAPSIGGQVALLSESGEVLAISDDDGMGPAELEQLLAAVGPLKHEALTVETVEHHGEPSRLAARCFSIESAGRTEGDPPLTVTTLIIVPERVFLAKVRENTRVVLIVVVLALLIAGAAGAWLIHELTRPLSIVHHRLGLIGRFELAPKDPPPSRVEEIHHIGTAVETLKTSLRSFQSYVPAELVRRLAETGEEARLGGELRTLTIHFSDIAGFTGLSENLPPAEVVACLGEYLDTMCQALEEEEGTVDKFMGDGIMAFFNAPRPLADHAARSCRAALGARQALARKREDWRAEGKPEFRARIGLHTGEVLVGNIGTPRRFAYTVIGDAANLAARLESLNKRYGTEIMASDATRQQAGEVFEWRKLDLTVVVGRTEALPIFELLGLKGQVDDALLAARDRYEQAFEAYLARDFEGAAMAFEEALEQRPGDKAASLLAARCRGFLAQPPPDDWSGVEIQTSK